MVGIDKRVYNREPMGFRGSIPVFSTANEYTENYEKISADHLASLQRDGVNPFIPEHLWVQMENSTIELVKKYSAPGDMILDIGVGLGRLLSHFPELQKYGLDISFGYLQEAEQKGIEVCYALVEDMPYKEGVFDIVVCTDVLEHVLDLNLCVTKILAALRKGGVLIVRVPYREELGSYLASPYKFVHVRNFDEYSLRLLFERIFDCEYIETMFGSYVLNESYLKYRIPYLRASFPISRLIRLTRIIKSQWSEALMKKLYRSVEINVVYRKK